MGAIIIGNRPCSVLGPVNLWNETGMEIKPGHRARKRISNIDLVVWHYTAGEGSARTLYNTMVKRKLGVEFFIDRNGTTWQFCDPVKVNTFDAGIVNRRSVGIEIACYGYRASDDNIPLLGRDRTTYETRMRSKTKKFAHFYPDQTAAAISLAFALSNALSIPKEVPKDGIGDLWTYTLEEHKLAKFSGHVGHYHVSSNKIDPGTALLDAFRILFKNGGRNERDGSSTVHRGF